MTEDLLQNIPIHEDEEPDVIVFTLESFKRFATQCDLDSAVGCMFAVGKDKENANELAQTIGQLGLCAAVAYIDGEDDQ